MSTYKEFRKATYKDSYKPPCSDRLKQYGLKGFIKRVFLALFRSFCYFHHEYLYILPPTGVPSSTLADGCVEIDREFLSEHDESFVESYEQSLNFLSMGWGVAYMVDGKVAGYAWTQPSGVYKFARYGRLVIPEGYVVFKNLFVLPEFRGRGIAAILNRARMEHFADRTAIGIILIDNRYSIRNWEKLGMKRVLEFTMRKVKGLRPKLKFRSTTPEGDFLKNNISLDENP